MDRSRHSAYQSTGWQMPRRKESLLMVEGTDKYGMQELKVPILDKPGHGMFAQEVQKAYTAEAHR